MTIPHFKLTIDGVAIEDDLALTIKNVRPENGISSLSFTLTDYKSRVYSDLVDLFDTVKLELQCKNPAYTTVFYGEVYALQPSNSPEVLDVYCRGLEHCLDLTHNDTSYGIESKNPTIFTPRHIVQDIVQNYVELSFKTGGATNWALNESDTYIDDIHSGLSVTNLTSQYHSNFTMINRLCDIVNAYAITLGAPEPGIHWFIDPTSASPRFYMKEIGDDHTSGNWPKYYGGTQTTATITQGINVLNYSLHQSIEPYRNNVLLASAFRKPAYDTWTEYRGAGTDSGSYLWDIVPEAAFPDVQLVDDNTAGLFVVGNYSLLIQGKNGGVLHAFYPSLENANWQFENIESVDNPPTLNFYYRKNDLVIDGQTFVRLFTTDHATDYFEAQFTDWSTNPDFEWLHVSLPIGNYWKAPDENRHKRWVSYGSPDWNNINGIDFKFQVTGSADWSSLWVDDLHFAGKLIREARDTSEVGTYKERQAFLRLDTALDDSFNITDNTGTAAMLAASELFKRGQFKTAIQNRFLTGSVTLPMHEDLLPGQQLYMNVGKKPDGSFRYQLDMRVQELTHEVRKDGYITKVNLTSDLWNSHTFDTPSAWGIIKDSAGALKHAEARDLKASGVDINIPRLTWDPTV